ncbi:class I SAM-dependent DNA methyltransferase [Pseudoneobacillus sp. C159]
MDRQDIKFALTSFSLRWSHYQGTEREEAQTFCNEFFSCFGLNRREVGAVFEQKIYSDSTRADLVWPDKLLIEMKRPSEKKLSKHYDQAYNYWLRLNPSPKYVLLSNFHSIEIHDPRQQYGKPLKTIAIDELEKNVESLLFMIDGEPVFPETQIQVTVKAADHTIWVYKSLLSRYSPDESRLFILQCVFAMFAEDISLIPRQHFTNALKNCIQKKEPTGDVLFLLFQRLNEIDERKRRGRDIPYINGGLFKDVFVIDLLDSEIKRLIAACDHDWSYIRPEIFGTLFQFSLAEQDRSKLGAYYTSEIDIQKIVQPTIVQPWLSIIERIKSIEDLTDAKRRLKTYKILDFACGSGNFLYVAYREIKKLERLIHDRETELLGSKVTKKPNAIFPISNVFGIDIDEFAVMLARVTLWVGQQLINKELSIEEQDLPLPDLSTIKCGDSLFIEWPKDVDVYIGNPPFLGAKRMRGALGDDYVDKLNKRYKDHNKRADLCTYFFRKVHDEMKQHARAGLIGTNTIRENHSRKASLDYILNTDGNIHNAWSSMVWNGDASVHVSIVNWEKGISNINKELNGKFVQTISSSLTSEINEGTPKKQRSIWSGMGFQGVTPRSTGFIIDYETAEKLIVDNSKNKEVIRPFLTARALQSNPLVKFDKYIIDFNNMPLEEAEEYIEPLKIIKAKVLPSRKKLRDTPDNYHCKLYWWQFHKSRPTLRKHIAKLEKYIVVARHCKEPHFTFVPKDILPDNGVVAIASDDLCTCGILNSKFHKIWAWMHGSTLKGDLRYTPTTILETYPFPEIEPDLKSKISMIAEDIINERNRLMALKGIGLTKIYNHAYPTLINLHSELDRLVGEAYGIPKKATLSEGEIKDFLLKYSVEKANQGN